jgi:hypothetical protein
MAFTFGGFDMSKTKRILRYLQFLACLMLVLQCYSAYGAGVEPIAVGTQLPQFTIGTPNSPEVQKYLGLKDDKPFTLSQVDAKLVVIDIFNSL